MTIKAMEYEKERLKKTAAESISLDSRTSSRYVGPSKRSIIISQEVLISSTIRGIKHNKNTLKTVRRKQIITSN